MSRSRFATLAAITLVATGLLAFGPAPAGFALPTVTGPPCAVGTPLQGDFDGDGKADLVVGAHRWTGTESVREQYLQPGDGGAATWILDTGELRSADLNGDVCADALLFRGGHEPWLKLAVGTSDGLDVAGATEVTIPQAADIAGRDEDYELVFEAAGLRHHGFSQVAISGHHTWEWGSERYRGYVDVLTVDASLAVTHTQIFEFPGVEGPIIGFGKALATSGSTIAVGAPGTKVNGHGGAGAVHLYTPDTSDPVTMVKRLTLTQNSPGVPGSAEGEDHFGSALAMRDGRLAVGVPNEAARPRAGLVQPIRWNEATRTYTAYRAISQDTRGVPGSNEAGDRFGRYVAVARGLTASGSYDILIGAEESSGKAKQAGSVTVANFTRSIYRTYTQSTKGVPGSSEAGDYFCHVGVLQTSPTVDTVLIGAPGEDTGGVQGVGRALRSDGKKLGSGTTWTNIAIPADAPAGMSNWGLDFAASSD